MIDPHTDPAGIGRLVIDAVGDDLTQVLLGEVVDLHLLGLPLGVPLATAGAELADQFLLLGIDRHHRLSLSLKRLGPPVDVLELGIPVRVALAFERLAVGLETIVQGVEQPVDRAFANGMPAGLELGRQLGRTLTRPL